MSMIKSLAEQIARWMSQIKKEENQLSHLTIEVVNWANPHDDMLPPDIKLEVFYCIDQIVTDVPFLEIVDVSRQIKELKVYSGDDKMPLDFGTLPNYIQQEIVEEIWRDYRQQKK